MSNRVEFLKYQGLGNDFILMDNTSAADLVLTPEQAKQLCSRNYGVGADGVIFAMAGRNDCTYTMRIFNSDGSEPQMCGNGIRCLAKFLTKLEKRSAHDDVCYRIWTNAGVISPVVKTDGSVTVDMGEPFLEPHSVPTTLEGTLGYTLQGCMGDDKTTRVLRAAVDTEVVVQGGWSLKVTAVGMGNPHGVVFVDSLDAMEPSFEVLGPALEGCTSAFPQRVNAEFVEVVDRQHLRMKVWERGAGPTLACGTGACAVVVAAVLTGRAERQCTVTLPGGDLRIEWNAENNRVFMTGPAVEVFSGYCEVTALQAR